MAEEDPSQERRPDNFHRGRGYPNRSFSRYRGRGRGRGDVQRTLHELGVTDLREHLNRKHHTEQSKSPPSDPSYNFLKDPTREQTSPVLKSPSSHRPSKSKTQDTYIQNPLNIKVELTTQTGQRNYSIDDDSTLPSIKHVPDYPYKDLSDERSRGSRSARARGRYNRYNVEERAKSSERKHDDKINEKPASQTRSKSVEGRSDTSNTRGRSSYRSRGNYRGRQRNTEYENAERGSKPRGRGRGRSFRHRGDASNGRYQHSDNAADDDNDREPQADQTENWDEEASKEGIKQQKHQHGEATDGPHRGRRRSFRYRGDASNRRYQHSDNPADDDNYREPQADQTENWDEEASKEGIKQQKHQHGEATDGPHRGRRRSFRYRGDASNRRYQHSDNPADDDNNKKSQVDQTENWDEDANKECIKKQEHQHEEATDDPHNAEEHKERNNEEDTPDTPEDLEETLENEPPLEDLQATVAKDNLIITSLDENKSKKRMVRFKENEGSGEGQSDDVEG